MTVVQVDLPHYTYQQLQERAMRDGRRVEDVLQELIVVLLPSPLVSERERGLAVLRAAGLVTQLSADEKQRAARSTATLEQVQASLAKGSGKTLSEIVIEQRGPKL